MLENIIVCIIVLIAIAAIVRMFMQKADGDESGCACQGKCNSCPSIDKEDPFQTSEEAAKENFSSD